MKHHSWWATLGKIVMVIKFIDAIRKAIKYFKSSGEVAETEAAEMDSELQVLTTTLRARILVAGQDAEMNVEIATEVAEGGLSDAVAAVSTRVGAVHEELAGFFEDSLGFDAIEAGEFATTVELLPLGE